MALILSGKEVAQVKKQQTKKKTDRLKKRGLIPRLHIIRVGQRPDDIHYQRSLEKVCGDTGITCTVEELTVDSGQQKLAEALKKAAADKAIHGILLFSPLPGGYDLPAATALIPPAKDVDCLNPRSAGALFTGSEEAYPPCTAAAVMEMLHYYDADLAGRNVTVVGRSLVVGKPLAMMLLAENATVTIAHSRSRDLPAVCRHADLVISAVGHAKMMKGNYCTPNQAVIDVGINEDPDNPGKMCGDVDFEAAQEIVAAITPAPGGVGSVTSSILCDHVADACEKSAAGDK